MLGQSRFQCLLRPLVVPSRKVFARRGSPALLWPASCFLSECSVSFRAEKIQGYPCDRPSEGEEGRESAVERDGDAVPSSREPSCPFAGTGLVLPLQDPGLCSEEDVMSRGVRFGAGTTAIFSSDLSFWFRELRRLFLWQPSSCQEPKFPRHPPPPCLSSLPQGWACSRHPCGGHRCPWAT